MKSFEIRPLERRGMHKFQREIGGVELLMNDYLLIVSKEQPVGHKTFLNSYKDLFFVGGGSETFRKMIV